MIRLVLPTLCSPRNTSLNFLSGDDAAAYSPPAGEGDTGVDIVVGGVGLFAVETKSKTKSRIREEES